MRKINKPLIFQEDVCDSIKDFKYRERVMQKSNDYDKEYKQVGGLLEDENSYILHDNVYKEYMKKMYSQRLSSKVYKDSYVYYKQIRELENKCPYCNYITRSVAQLDHYLPKSIFPVHAITVNNLIPICRDCNDIKDNYYSKNESETLLHPYYDETLDEVINFLKCRVIEESNIGFKFYIEKQSHWDEVIFNRVKKHFEILKIDDLYRTDFEADFVTCFEELVILYEENNDINEVCITLDRKLKSMFKVKLKPWAYVGFKSLRESKWFLEEYLPSKCSK